MMGTGTSHGIPMIGCRCPVCTSDDPRDKRMRSSALVEMGGRSFLIDTTPELRMQCLACNITRVDAVLYTHDHADHVAGLDDLRRFNVLQGTSIIAYGDENTTLSLRRMFPYAFEHKPDYPSTKPQLELAVIKGSFEAFGVPIIPIPLLHGKMPVLGFRFGGFAYCTDVSFIPEESYRLLEGLDVLVLDALRLRPHPTHFNLEQAIVVARRIGAIRTYFTHIAHELAHETTNARLSKGMMLAYDGQIILP